MPPLTSYTRVDLEALASLLGGRGAHCWEQLRYKDSNRLRNAAEALQNLLSARPRVKHLAASQLCLILGPPSALYRALQAPPEELPFIAAAASDTVAGVVAQVRLARGF